MAMLPRLWSLNGLAVELRLDRRTVARKMAQVRPDGLLAKKPAWFLSTAAPILIHEVGNGAEPEDGIAERAGGPFSMGRNPVDEGICTVLTMLAARLPAEAAITAVRAGASEELTRQVTNSSQEGFRPEARRSSQRTPTRWR
jgi:hypothetical protein